MGRLLILLAGCFAQQALAQVPNENELDPSEVQEALIELGEVLEARFVAIEQQINPTPTPVPRTAPTILNLALDGGVYNGEPRPIYGYYLPGDCESLLYVWDEASEVEPNGLDEDHPGTIICPESHEGMPGRWIGQVLSHTNVRWFGAQDGGRGQERVFQAAVDTLLNDTTKVASLYIPAGFYVFDGPVTLLRDRNDDGIAEFFSLEIKGDGGFPYSRSLAGVSHIHCNHNDTFAFGVHKGKGVRIRNISIQGRNTVNFATPAELFEAPEEAWVVNGCRDTPTSPYAGIAIDFAGRDSVAEKYPGLEWAYHPRNGGGGSTDIQIEDCRIAGFVAGVILSPSGTTQNSEQIECRRTRVEQCMVAYAPCQLQNRSINLTDITCWGNTRDIINCSRWGEGSGQLPMMKGGNFAGAIKQIFITAGNTQQVAFQQVFCESIYRIGDVSAGTNSAMLGCMFKFSYPVAGYGSPDAVFTSRASTTSFIGCSLIHSANPPDTKSIGVDGFVSFENTTFDTLPHHVSTLGVLRFANCSVRHTSGIQSPREITSGGRTPLPHTQNANRRPMGPSQVFIGHQGREFTNGRNAVWRHGVARSAFRLVVDQHQNTATFQSDNPNLRVGDVVMISKTGARGTSSVIRSIVDGQVTLEAVSDSLAEGNYFLYIYREQVFRTPVLGDLTRGSNVITNVLSETPIRQAFVVGNRISIAGLPPGCHVVAVDEEAQAITVSDAATQTDQRVLLTDCDMRTRAFLSALPTWGVWPAGAIVEDTSGKTNGWRCEVGGKFGGAPEDLPLFIAM